MMSFLRLPYLFRRTWVKDVARVNFAMLALHAFHTRFWNEAQIEMWKMARKIFDIGKAWIRVPLDRVFGRKLLCFENCRREIHFCQLEIDFATFTSAKKCRREKFWVRKAGYNLSYSISLKKLFCFNLHKKRCTEASRFKVGSSFSFSNLELSEIIFSISLL